MYLIRDIKQSLRKTLPKTKLCYDGLKMQDLSSLNCDTTSFFYTPYSYNL